MPGQVKYRKPLVRRGGNMTYILGINCTDGVVMIGDRKIIYNDTVDWQQKIFGLPVEKIWFDSTKYYPVGAIGSAGSVFLGQKFRDDASSILNKYVKFNVRTFMEELRGKVTEYYKLHRSSLQPWDFSAGRGKFKNIQAVMFFRIYRNLNGSNDLKLQHIIKLMRHFSLSLPLGL